MGKNPKSEKLPFFEKFTEERNRKYHTTTNGKNPCGIRLFVCGKAETSIIRGHFYHTFDRSDALKEPSAALVNPNLGPS